MARALQLAERGMYTTTPNPRVGCVIARGAQVLGEGWHERVRRSARGGTRARRCASARQRSARCDRIRDARALQSSWPYPAVQEALLAAGIGRVVAAMRDPNPHAARGADRLRAAGVAVDIGYCEAQSRELNPGWIKRMQTGRPWLRLKIAASLDGRTALAKWREPVDHRRRSASGRPPLARARLRDPHRHRYGAPG